MKMSSKLLFLSLISLLTATSCTFHFGKVIHVESFNILDEEIKLDTSENKNYQINYEINPETATNKSIKWTTTDNGVVTVNNGYLTAINEGEATIVATTIDGNLSSSVNVSVFGEGTPLINWDSSQKELRKDNKTFTIYNINDFHGTIMESDSEPGIFKLTSYLKEKKTENPEGFILTSSGDMWQGSADSNITKGAIINEWMNYANFKAMALGNHEFDWTIDVIKENQKAANFPYLACNIIDDETNEPVKWVKPYTTFTQNGVNIGIIGVIGEGITASIYAPNVKGLSFANPTRYVTEWANYLRNNGADLIVLLDHDSMYSMNEDIINSVDAMFGGHNHAKENLTDNYGKPALEAHCNGDAISVATINGSFEGDTFVIDSSYGRYENLNLSSYVEDSGAKAIYDKYSEEINSVKNIQLGFASNEISRYDAANLAARYMYQYYEDELSKIQEFDIVGANHNQARDSIPSGVITYGDIYKSFPFDNNLCVVKLKGSQMNGSYSGARSDYKYFPNGTYFNYSQDYYVLTIDYTALRYNPDDIVYTYTGIYARDIISKYIGIDYPLSNI